MDEIVSLAKVPGFASTLSNSRLIELQETTSNLTSGYCFPDTGNETTKTAVNAWQAVTAEIDKRVADELLDCEDGVWWQRKCGTKGWTVVETEN